MQKGKDFEGKIELLENVNDFGQDSRMMREFCEKEAERCAPDAIDPQALSRIDYGLYLVTARQGERDNGLIVNAVMQVANTPDRIAVAIHKNSLTHDMICATGTMNVCCLSADTPYTIFQRFGMESGKTVSKFDDFTAERTANGLPLLMPYTNAFFSLSVAQTVDLKTHTLFLCTVTEGRILTDASTMTYEEYQKNMKPQAKPPKTTGYICRVCGYVYEGDPLPENFVCPLCLHGAADFEPISAD
ncbi:MAG: hypothetical protein E7585_03380 [Ruminococcaceae bacterium]|nr:hypothetical protein [Oscillospiraceae bacterium]